MFARLGPVKASGQCDLGKTVCTHYIYPQTVVGDTLINFLTEHVTTIFFGYCRNTSKKQKYSMTIPFTSGH